jgi:predicted AAA+ superfamily ATPase
MLKLVGEFSAIYVFNFNEKTDDRLEGIEKPDPITLSKLIAQEREQKIILDNTEYFLKGYPANNIILYGNRGTGKSSLVKALQNEYADRKLRIVQLKKSQIGFFPEFVRILDRLPFKFIIFIDDLSFDNMEQDYKNLKSLLEGGVEARPDNVIIYATSNRRHLVKETIDERSGEEVHVRDNIEEKLSLADRFGITVTFLSPDQVSYCDC